MHGYVAAALAFIALVAIGSYLYTHRSSGPTTGATSTSATTSTTVGGVVIEGDGATVVETTESLPTAPNYRSPLVFSASTDAAVKAVLQRQFDATVKILDKDKNSFDAWVNLGTVRKMAGDYKGAETDWKYVTQIYPSSTVGFDNLGALYLDFLKDFVKAEAMFKQSIKLDSHDINAYQQLFALYTVYGYKQGTSAAADLVAQGLKANPNNQTLLQMQSQLQ